MVYPTAVTTPTSSHSGMARDTRPVTRNSRNFFVSDTRVSNFNFFSTFFRFQSPYQRPFEVKRTSFQSYSSISTSTWSSTATSSSIPHFSKISSADRLASYRANADAYRSFLRTDVENWGPFLLFLKSTLCRLCKGSVRYAEQNGKT